MHLPQPTPRAITVQRWPERKSEGPVYGVCELYVETCYLPLMGVGSLITLRHLSYRLLESEAVVVVLPELAAELGFGRGLGHTSPLVRSLNRLVDFGAVTWRPARLQVRMALPPVPPRLLDRLPARAETFHWLWLAAQPDADRLLATQASRFSSLIRYSGRDSVPKSSAGKSPDRMRR